MKNKLIFLVILIILLSGCNMNKNKTESQDIVSQEEPPKIYLKSQSVSWAFPYEGGVVKGEPEIKNYELTLNDVIFLTEKRDVDVVVAEIKITNITNDLIEISSIDGGVMNRNKVNIDDFKNRYSWTDKVYYGEKREVFTSYFDTGTEWTLTFSKEPFEDVEN